MTSKTWAAGTVIDHSWLQDVNDLTYNIAGTGSGQGASLIGSRDVGNYYATSTVEGNLQEVGPAVILPRRVGNTQNAAFYYTGDMGAALQAAHDALGPDGGTIIVPANNSFWTLSTQTASFTKPIRIVGEGWYNSEILSQTASLTWIRTTSRLDIENVHFSALNAARGNNIAVKVLSTATNHSHSRITNNYFDGFLRAYWSQRTNAIEVHDNLFNAVGGTALYLENLTNPDEGDSFITSNTFSGDSTSISIVVPSTSGINICNNKFNTGVVGHLQIVGAVATLGNYLISNNSFEGHTDYAIKLLNTGGPLTKSLIGNNQFSSSCNNHVVVSNGAQNTLIHGNTFNDTISSHGNGVSVESGAVNVNIANNSFHQILSGVSAAAGVSAGISMSGNRFAEDVTNIFVGDDGLSSHPPQREISLSRFMSVSSNAVYSDAIKLIGFGTMEIKIYGIVQGAGVCNYHRRVLVSGTAFVDIDAATTAGSLFDVQLAASGGYLVVSVKRNGATGTTLTAYVEVTARGQITDFKKA